MTASIREIHFPRNLRLEHYVGVDHVEPEIGRLRLLADGLARALRPGRVWMLNSTATGGGVAEMLPAFGSLLGDLGLDVRWLVLEPGRPDFFPVTKALHNMLHGAGGLDDEAAARRVYDEVSEAAARHLPVDAHDVLVVHDPQPAGVARHLQDARRPRLVWRCHVGTGETNARTEAAWRFLAPDLAPYERLVFSAAPYVPPDLLDRSVVIAPGIDPLSHKNRELRPYKLVGILRAAGIVEGPPTPAWAAFDAPVQRFDGARFVSEPIPDFLHRPAIVQISRFDRLKGFDLLLPAFEELLRLYPGRAAHLRADTARLTSELDAVQLVLAGPAPTGVQDDPEAAAVLDELCRLHAALPPQVRRRVHVLLLPMNDVKQNALVVNALQRIAAVVVQPSRREGFGLTVAEAMWKGVPIVGSDTGGISLQLRHGVDGLLVPRPDDPRELAEALLQTFARPQQTEAMGRSARLRVREQFLVLTDLRNWLDLLRGLLGVT